eukprot:449367-Hanusia_phi.AAC.1
MTRTAVSLAGSPAMIVRSEQMARARGPGGPARRTYTPESVDLFIESRATGQSEPRHPIIIRSPVPQSPGRGHGYY